MKINKVLVCDDSKTEHINIDRIISSKGCTVITAYSGQEAIDKAREEKPDLIFLDILMPNMGGYETCRMIQSDPELKDIPVIFITSKDQKSDQLWAKMQGGKDLIVKPYEDEQIVDRLVEPGVQT